MKITGLMKLVGPNSDILRASAYPQLPTTFTADLTPAQDTIFMPKQTQVVCSLTAHPSTQSMANPSQIPNHIHTLTFFCLHQSSLNLPSVMGNFMCKLG